jgi:MoaA/NifB/PqqE/SkfB family radical SAM enzyme
MDIHALAAMSRNRPVYCWGAGRYGVMAMDALRRYGVSITGFIDKTIRSSREDTIKILAPEAIDSPVDGFVVVTSMFFEHEIECALLAKGYANEHDYVLYSDLKRWSFEIDVSGVCQLKCPTCPNGNFTGRKLSQTMMSFALYRQILDKLIAEVDFLPDVQLYSWGEPLLNPSLPDIVAYSVDQGVAVGISSNLNDIRYLERTIRAKPDWFRVSLSGTGNQYGLTHRGGNWDKVASNMEQLAKLRDSHHPELIIEINYHLYRNNEKNLEEIAAICERNGFLLKPNAAYIDPLDTLIDYAEGKPLPESMLEIAQSLILDIDAVIQDCRLSPSKSCVRENTIVIHSDGTIRQCPHVFGNQYKLEKNILSSSISEIGQLFLSRDLCARCKSLGMNNFYAHFLSHTKF